MGVKMKILVLAFLMSVTSFASQKAAREAFLADDAVNERISIAGPQYVLGDIQVVFLKGSCGYLGCVSDYLVGAPLLSMSANPQSKSVLARVQLTGDVAMSVLVLPEYTTSIMTE